MDERRMRKVFKSEKRRNNYDKPIERILKGYWSCCGAGGVLQIDKEEGREIWRKSRPPPFFEKRTL